ncbi:PEP-CTERM sorting domain-containing protein [Kiritimatiellota bacterium B12222]|nr:PEP-CTERM sorting domain-containing protein [Kiritimatiellota bacterium B12222]
MKIIKSTLTLLAFIATAHASIVVSDSDFYLDASGQNPMGTDRTISDFSVAAGEKLVVTTTMEGGDISGITFGGISLNSVYNTANGVQRITTYYLDVTTATTDDVVVSYVAETAGTMGFAAISISGAAAGGPADFSSSATQNAGLIDIETGSLVIGTFTVNSAGSITPTVPPVTDPLTPSIEIYDQEYIGNGGTSGNVTYFTSPTDGTYNYGFSGGNTRPAAGAVVFNAIPEPSTFLLLGLAALTLVEANRRRK